jgi:hypothetical protein
MSNISDRYKGLSSELKQRLLAKIAGLPEEQQSRAFYKLGVPMSEIASEGVQELDPMQTISTAADSLGEGVTEALGKRQVNPNISAAAGLATSMAPDILMGGGAAALGRKFGRAVEPRIISGGKKVLNTVFGEGKDTAALRAKQALDPLQERLTKQSMALNTVPVRAEAREAVLGAEKGELGKAIGKAEELAGFPMKDTPDDFAAIMKDPKALNKMSKTMRKVAETPTHKLTQMGGPELQTIRKFAQTFRDVGPEATTTIKANIKMGGKASTEALRKIDSTFDSVLADWEAVANKLDRLPTDAGKQKAAIKNSLLHTRLAIKRTQRLNDIAIAAGAKRDTVRKNLIRAGIPSALLGGILYTTVGN